MTDRAAELLWSYLPANVVRDVRASRGLPPPRARALQAAVLLADISGFTSLADQLCREGPDGIEKLSITINECFGRLLEVISAHGGEVLRFAGDACITLWSVAPEGSEDLQSAARRAVACGLELRRALEELRFGDATLGLRVGISAGDLVAIHVGEAQAGARCDYVVAGEAITEMGNAERRAARAECVVAPRIVDLLGDAMGGTQLGEGFLRVERVLASPPQGAPAPTRVAEDLPHLGLYVAQGLVRRLAESGASFRAELRRVTTVFIHLGELDVASPRLGDVLHDAFRLVDRAVNRAEGTINQFVIDDKGPVLLLAWGLPASAHEDDPVRAVRAAMEIQRDLTAIGVHVSLGITTGRVFCGDRGADTRREYAVIGDPVNTAARLMSSATGRILCDDATMEASRSRLRFDALPPLELKGKAEAILAHTPTGERAAPSVRHGTAMIGRARERESVRGALDSVSKQGVSGVLVIEGQAGIGKSVLVDVAKTLAQELHFTVWQGECEAIESSTPYFAWRGILRRLLGVGPTAEHTLHSLLPAGDRLVPLLPLLGMVLPLDLPQTEVTTSLDGPARADGLHGVLTALIAHRAEPTLLVLEDVHWLDSGSWEALRRVVREVPRVLLLLSHRPLEEALTRAQSEILRGDRTTRLLLDPLPPDDAERLACETLGASALSPEISQFLTARAEGHPFFMSALANALHESGLTVVLEGVCALAAGADLDALAFPTTLEGIITARVDKLSPRSQVTLKVASVIGRVFARQTLAEVLPKDPSDDTAARALEADLPEILGDIATTELIRQDADPAETEFEELWLFTHALAQDVVYGLMLGAQRRALHHAIARWIDSRSRSEPTRPPPHALLAYHYHRAARWEEAADHLELAAKRAFETFSNTETARFYRELLALAPQLTDLSPLREAGWEQGLGRALFDLGQLEGARIHTRRAFALAGRPLHESAAGLAFAMLRAIGKQLALRLLPKRLHGRLNGTEQLITDACLVLVTLAYMNNRADELVYANLVALNAAEVIAEGSPSLGSLYGFMAIVWGGAGVHRIARYYEDKAIEIAAKDERQRLGVMATRGIYRIGAGDYPVAKKLITELMDHCDERKDGRNWELAAAGLGYVHQVRGEFEEGVTLYEQVHLSGLRRNDVQTAAWGLNGMAMCLIPLGRFEEVFTCIRKSGTQTDELSRLACLAFEAVAHLRSGNIEKARALADETAERLAKSSLAAYATYKDYAAVAEVYVHLCEADADGPKGRGALVRVLRRACKTLVRRSRIYPIGAPQAWLRTGQLRAIEGDLEAARRCWQKARAISIETIAPYEQGLAEAELGRRAEGDERAAHLGVALELFERVHAAWDAKRVTSLLEFP